MKHKLSDGLENVVSGIGTQKDKSVHSTYTFTQLSNQELLSAYRSAWLPRKIVDMLANDAVSKWREWSGTNDEVARLEDVERRLKVKAKVLGAIISARLYGGSAIYIDTETTTPDIALQDTEVVKRLTIVQKDYIELPRRVTGDPLEYVGDICRVGTRDIHKSRLLRFYGKRVPGEDGWADSVLQSTMTAIKNADSIAANIAALIFEAKVDVFKVPGLMVNLKNKDYESDIMKRLTLAQMGKSTVNALLMDSEEEFDQKQLNLSGVDAVHLTALQIVSGAAEIPATRLLGRSASGLNSSGETEVLEYYDSLISYQELVLGPTLYELDKMIKAEAGVPDASYTWRSLWEMPENEVSEIRSRDAATIETLTRTELFRPDELFTPAVALMAKTMENMEKITEEYDGNID